MPMRRRLAGMVFLICHEPGLNDADEGFARIWTGPGSNLLLTLPAANWMASASSLTIVLARQPSVGG